MPKLCFSSASWADRHHKKFERIVSVRSPSDKPARFGLRLPGSVLTAIILDEDHYYNSDPQKYMTEQKLEEILEFCTKDNPVSVLIHCQAGCARSAALAICLLIINNPEKTTKNIMESLLEYRQNGDTQARLYPTRTILSVAQKTLDRPDLLETAGHVFSTEMLDSRTKTCLREYDLYSLENFNKITKAVKENPGSSPLNNEQLKQANEYGN